MTKGEFIKYYTDAPNGLTLAGGLPISDENYKIIDFVYTHHPAISEIHGKEQIVNLYKEYGMAIIRDMYDRAKRASELEKTIRYHKTLAQEAEDELSDLRCGK